MQLNRKDDSMLNEKMQAVMEHVKNNVAERDELVHYIALSLLTKKNLFVLGDTGQSKSQVTISSPMYQRRSAIQGAYEQTDRSGAAIWMPGFIQHRSWSRFPFHH